MAYRPHVNALRGGHAALQDALTVKTGYGPQAFLARPAIVCTGHVLPADPQVPERQFVGRKETDLVSTAHAAVVMDHLQRLVSEQRIGIRMRRPGHLLALGKGGRYIDPVQIALEQPGNNTQAIAVPVDRKSTRLNSSHVKISYAVFC